MNRWLRRIGIAAALIVIAIGVLFENATRVGRGWWNGEPFYEGRPASYWAGEIERWETKDPDWETQKFVRRQSWPGWVQRLLPDSRWPTLLDGDPNGLPVLRALREYPSNDLQDWARIGTERIDNDERGPYKFKHPSVIVTAQLFEVDEAFYQEVAKAKWRSQAELEEMERLFLEKPEQMQPGAALVLDKQKLVLGTRDVKLELNKEGTLLSLTKEITCLPSPSQLRKGEKGPQKIDEGVVLRARVQISTDRRFIYATFIEKSTALEGIAKVPLVLDAKGEPVRDARGADAVAEIAHVKESTLSVPRTISDGGTLLLPLQYRPAGATEKGRWLVARIELRIHIEAEDRLIRGQTAK